MPSATIGAKYLSAPRNVWNGSEKIPLDVGGADGVGLASGLKDYVINSPVLIGDPKAPTPAPGDNDTSVATTAFVTAAIAAAEAVDEVPSNSSPVMDGVAAPGVLAAYSRGDHVHPSDTSRVADTGDTMTGPLVMPAGSAAATVINFGTPGTGIWSQSAFSQINFASGGVNKFNIAGTAVQSLVPVTVASGSAAAPGFGFNSDTDCGFYLPTIGEVRLALSGVDVVKFVDSDPTYGGKTVDAVAGQLKEFGVPIVNRYGNAAGNLLRRNGGCEIWQRGAGGTASFTVTSLTQYTADGWYVTASGSLTLVASQQPGLVNGSQFSLKVQRPAGQTGATTCVIGYPLDTDELFPALGQTVRLSFIAVAGANYSPASGALSALVRSGTGTPVKNVVGYTGQQNVIFTGITLTGTATRYSIVSAGVVATNSRQMEVMFQYTPVGTAGADDSFTIDDVQLEVVADANQQASPFQRLNFVEQLVLCQRHYFKTFPYQAAPAQNGGTGGSIGGSMYAAGTTSRAVNGDLHYPVPLRVVPTIVTFNTTAANAEVRDVTGAVDCTTFVPTANFPNALNFTATGNAASVVGNRWNVHIIADAGI